MTATLHKLTAGDGYTYLTRQVAVDDSTERGYSSLGDYYSAKGEAPGVWAGRGLDISGQVTEAQMLNLFGQGLHPDADRIRHEATTSGVGVAAADAATRLGQPFPTFEPNQQWRDRLSDAYAAFNTVRGNAVNKPIPAEERERIRTDVAQAMFAESSGRDPRTASELTSFVAQASRPDRTAVAGYDVTFSPVKSVSTLWAVAPREISEQVEAAHAAAVAETIGWLERNVGYTRIGAHGVAQVDVKGLIAATFTHRDSRAGDPDLHTHVAISNKVQTLDGRWLALDGRMIHRYLVAASEHYNTRLEAETIQRVGGRFVERAAAPGKRPIRELADVDRELNEAFSCRRRDITAHRTELVEAFRQRNGRLPTSVEMIALAQQANLATRQAKHEPLSLAEQREQWREQAIGVLGSAENLREMVQRAITPQTAAPAELSPAEMSRMAFDTVRAVEAGRAQWARHNVVAEAQRQLRYAGHAIGADTDLAAEQVTAMALGPEHSIPIGTDPEPAGAAAPEALTRLDGSSVYRMAGGQLHTSPVILDAERAVVAAAGQGSARTVSPGDVEIAMLEWSANNGGRTLNTSQAAMVQAVATSDRRLQLALAPAGTGKTTTMGALATVWRSNGGDLVALAPQAFAAQELAAQIPGVTADTVDKLVFDLSGHPLADPRRWQRDVTERTLIIVDEAGLASTLNLSAVVGFARDKGARILLVGDDRQRGAAGAGGVLRDVEATHGSLALDEVLRFRDLQQGAASLAMRAGDIGAVGYYLDRDRVHSVAADEAAAAVFSAWHADKVADVDSLIIAPTLELVTELNLRARAARLAGSAERVGRELTLPNGETVSAGDLVVTKKNARWLSVGGTDFVRNNNRWTVEQVHRDGSVTATEITRGVTRTLPADYLTDGYVRLGYAATTAGVQGLTVEGNAYALLTTDMTRNELYPAMTRGKGHNHGFIITGGVGDAHEVITPEAISPQTRGELFAAIIQRDGSDRSALTQLRESADPVLRLAPAAFAYEHAILTGAETLIGPEKLAALTAAAEQAVPGITDAHAWDTMRGHLATITMQGRDAIAGLRSAAKDRDLDSARDLAAVLDWRLDHSGNHSLGEGPLPWLPAIPTGLVANPDWGNYLSARERLVVDLADQVDAAAGSWTVQTAPAWATPYLASGGLTQQLAVWRAAQGVLDADLRPAGPRPQRIAHIKLHSELTRAAAVVAGDPADGTGRWSQALSAAGAQQVTTDPYWPVLISRLTMADTAGLPVDRLITAALGEKPLPSEAPAAALWTRLAPHIGAPTTAVTTHALRPAWIADLATVLGTQTAERIAADRLWPAIVTHVDVAARAGRDPAALVTDAAGMLAAVQDSTAGHQHPVVLLTNITALTDPEPLAEGEALPADPTEADLLAPADAFTTVDTAAAAVDEIPAPDEPAGPEQLVPDQPIDSTDDGPAVGDRRLFDVLAAAHDYYRQQVPGSWVPDYLDGRGLSVLTDRAGLAPAGWTSAVDHLRGAGYADPEILAAGLARTSSRGTLIDAFRDRVMLPIHHTDGQVVGFTGRRNPATVDDYNPKYLNSPTTAVYRKTDQPYGLTPPTIAALRAGADLAIVEGPMDAEAINLAAAGRVVAVAPLGTALTAGQLRTLNKVAPLADRQVLTVMDNDQAGRAASVRAFHLLADTGIPDPQAVTLPAGRNDPAETLARDGAARLDAALINDTHPLADTVVDDILDRWPAPTSPEYQIGALNEVAPVVAALPAQRRQEQATRVADRLTLDSVTVIDAVIEHLPAPPIDPRSTLGLPERPVLLTEQQQQPARPLAGVATKDLRTRTQDRAAELAGARAAAAQNSARIELLRDDQLVSAEQDRQRQVLQRAAAVTAYRADRDLLEQMRPQWVRRSVEIDASEQRIADGGRRAARQQTERLAELRRQHEAAAEQVRAASARVREFQRHVGDPAQQDQTLAAAAQIRQRGADLLAATRDRQDTELTHRRAAAPALERTTQDAQRDVDQLTDELAIRPDAIEVPDLEPQFGDSLVGPRIYDDYHDLSVDDDAPEVGRDIER